MSRYFPLATCLFASVLACSAACCAQVQASQEPRRHNVFENDRVRILDVHIPPGDTTLMHKHSTPSVFIVLSNTKTGSQVLVEPEKPGFNDGHIWFEGFYTRPRIHRVWNSDTMEFHVIDMEILNKTPQSINPPMGPLPGTSSFTLLFDEPPVRGYRFTLPAQHSFRLRGLRAPIVVIGLTNSVGNVTVNDKSFVKKGDYLFIPSGSEISFTNSRDGSASQDFALFELK